MFSFYWQLTHYEKPECGTTQKRKKKKIEKPQQKQGKTCLKLTNDKKLEHG